MGEVRETKGSTRVRTFCGQKGALIVVLKTYKNESN